MNINRLKKKKFLLFLIIIMIISFLGGSFFIAILNDNCQSIIKSSILEYFNGINKGNFQYLRSLYSVLTSNLIGCFFIWLMGISMIGGMLGILFLIYKSFIVGFSFISIIYTYGFKAIFLAFIYIIPEILNLFIIFILVYYSCSFSWFLFNSLFRHKEYNRRIIMNRYMKLLIGGCLFILFNSLLIVFLIPNLLRIF